MSCVKPQTLPPIEDREEWQRRREARRRVLDKVRARRLLRRRFPRLPAGKRLT